MKVMTTTTTNDKHGRESDGATTSAWKATKTNVGKERGLSKQLVRQYTRLAGPQMRGMKQALDGENTEEGAARERDLARRRDAYEETYDVDLNALDAEIRKRAREGRCEGSPGDKRFDSNSNDRNGGTREGANSTLTPKFGHRERERAEFTDPALVRTPIARDERELSSTPSSHPTTSEECVEPERARASSSEEDASNGTRPKGQPKLCDLKRRERASKNNTSTLPTYYAVLNQGVTPEELLQGKDVDQWRAFVDQGAMVLRLCDGWDILDDVSVLCDLSWIGQKGIKLRTLGADYQYLRQSLPHSKTGLLPPFTAMDGYDYDTELGAFIDDFQENIRAHADQFRLMGIDARESWFLHQVHHGFPLQFPYLQGLAYNALISNVASKTLVDEGEEKHPWDPRLLGERSPSILRRCLQLCESVNVSVIAEAKAVDRDARVAAARLGELRETGGTTILADEAAMRRRIERKSAGKSGVTKMHWKSKIKQSRTPKNDATEYIAKASERRLWGVGIVSPWLYYMGVGSIFPLHFEDYAFGSANVILARPDSQAWVIWYSIPRADLYLLHVYLQELLGDAYSLDVLEMRKLWLDPMRIEQWNEKRKRGEDKLRVYRHVQTPGDYVVTDYGSVHWGLNLGAGWKAAVNFAYLGWKPAAEEVNAVYRQLEEETGFSRHHRCCPKFHELGDRFSEANMVAPDTKER